MTDWYEPGFRAGGPIRSCANFTGNLKQDYDLYIFTGDRDFGDDAPYDSIPVNQWIEKEGYHILYAGPGTQSYSAIRHHISELNPDFVYLNSLFSKNFTLYPLLMKRRGSINAKLVLAPRGMLKDTALAFKKTKKTFFLRLFKWFGLHKPVLWQATDVQEKRDIETQFNGAEIVLAANFPPPVMTLVKPLEKISGQLNILFVGRIHPIKNLHVVIEALLPLKGDILFSIVGSMEDANYWEQCKDLVSKLDSSVKTEWLGECPHHAIQAVYERSHIFALPTKGENFGHAIFEALSAGKPVLISDQTPWRNLAPAKAGWDLPLNDVNAFTNALNLALQWNQDEYDQWSQAAWNFARRSVDLNGLKSLYSKIFS